MDSLAATCPDDGSNPISTATASIEFDPGYRPGADEPFMSERQLAYFRRKLLDWRDSILREASLTLETLKAEPLREPDVTDRAASETDWGIELRTRDRQR